MLPDSRRPAEVGDRDQRDDADRDLDLHRVELRHDRHDLADRRRGRHRDRHHVVDQEGGRGDQPEQRAEVLLRDRVRAAAARVRPADLAVRESRRPPAGPRSRSRRRPRTTSAVAPAAARTRMISCVAYADELIASELKIASAFFFESRSPASSSLASGRPIATPRTRAHAPPDGRSWAGWPPRFATSGARSARSGRTAEWGRSTRTRRSAGLRPLSGRLPPIIRLPSRAGRALGSRRSVAAPPVGDVRDHRVLAADERRLQPLGGLVIQQPVPPVPGDVLGQDDDRDRRGLLGRPGEVEDVEVGGDRADQGPVRRLDDDERDARELALPALAQRLAGLGVLGDVDGPDVRRERSGRRSRPGRPPG